MVLILLIKFQQATDQVANMSAKCGACGKTAYPQEQIKFSGVWHKGCFKCSVCGVRLRPEMAKMAEKESALFCERDWREQGKGGIGVKANVGNVRPNARTRKSALKCGDWTAHRTRC